MPSALKSSGTILLTVLFAIAIFWLSRSGVEEVKAPVPPGTYVVYQVVHVKPGLTTKEAAEKTVKIYRYRIGDDAPALVAASSAEDWDLLRLLGEEIINGRQAVLHLDGSLINREVSPYSFATPDGRWLLDADYDFRQDTMTLVVRDAFSSEIRWQVVLEEEDFPAQGGFPEYVINFSDDGYVVYLQDAVPGKWFPLHGPVWRYDFVSGELVEVPFELHNSASFRLDPNRQLLISTRYYVDKSEFAYGDPPTPPSTVKFADLQTGTIQTLVEDDNTVINDAWLSPDATRFALERNRGWRLSELDPDIWVATIGDPLTDSDRRISGQILDWLDEDILVVSRKNELLLYDIKTRLVRLLDRDIGQREDPDLQSAAYIGSVVIP